MPRGIAFLACTDEVIYLKVSDGELEAHVESVSMPVIHAQRTGAVSLSLTLSSYSLSLAVWMRLSPLSFPRHHGHPSPPPRVFKSLENS